MFRNVLTACFKGQQRSTHFKEPRGTLDLGNLIGEGSFGQVYKGHNLKSNNVVAIKMMNPSEDTQKEIKKEIKIHKKVSEHENIASFYGAYQQPGSIMMPVMIEMEFCGGGTLFHLIHSPFSQGLPEPCIAYICREVLKGLSHLQKKKIMHRDIKSLNIAVTEDAGIRLIDFGLARKVKRFRPCKELLGTPHYIAPEVWTCSSYDYKCDIWALGITAIEMAEARCPLLHLQREAVGEEIVFGDPPTLSRPYRWSAEFNSFIEACLTKDPKDRPTAKFLLQNHPFVANIQDELQVIAELKYLVGILNEARHWQEDKARIQSVEKISQMPDKNARANDVDLASKPAEEIPSAAVEEVPSDVVVSLDTKIVETAENAEDEDLASKTAEEIPNAAKEEVRSDIVMSLDTKIEETAQNAEDEDLASKPAEDIPNASAEEVHSDVVSLDTIIEETALNAEDEVLALKTAEESPNAAVEEMHSDDVVSLDTKREKTAENAEETASEVQVDEPASEVVKKISPQDVGSTDIEGKQDTTTFTINIGESEKDVEASTIPKEDPLQSSEEAPELSVAQELSPQEEVGSTDTDEEQTTVCHINMADSDEALHAPLQSREGAPVLEENTGYEITENASDYIGLVMLFLILLLALYYFARR